MAASFGGLPPPCGRLRVRARGGGSHSRPLAGVGGRRLWRPHLPHGGAPGAVAHEFGYEREDAFITKQCNFYGGLPLPTRKVFLLPAVAGVVSWVVCPCLSRVMAEDRVRLFEPNASELRDEVVLD